MSPLCLCATVPLCREVFVNVSRVQCKLHTANISTHVQCMVKFYIYANFKYRFFPRTNFNKTCPSVRQKHPLTPPPLPVRDKFPIL